MEATTVDEAVSSLKELYAEGTEHYTHWKRKRTLGNHYCRKSSESGVPRDVITCALSISLELARNQIEETYDIATVLIGTDFSTGDSTTSTTASAFLRPKVSVFSMFCPEAMTLQVDLSKPIPDAPKRCKCGYRWNPLLPGNKDYIVLKDGFRMSSRFLAKSHSDRNVFACCLCVPTGTTDNYESADALRAHINLHHRKWQILHDRDIY
ncbi:hypothetical protein CSAL01_07013 [Colletotrichum salicis]|uniref:C2H2-type domain-containing protein n=1 Tax=Colletotrichum salicis TaxID=1209931 RepID=A0A135SZF6_9PEZI|nr:hypothetical protein CSAL01_07013 [Colletotrichum salicis]